MANELIQVKKIDSILAEYEEKIREVGIQWIWLTGDFLQEAKKKVIEITGNGHAPGFLDWAKRKFGYKPRFIQRCIKESKEHSGNLKAIWGNIRKNKTSLTTFSHGSGYVKPELRIGDFRKVLADIPDNSVDLILTDPPYGEKSVVLYEELGILAARILKPDGSLFAYTGQSVLGPVLSVLSKSLRYWWTICMEHSGTGQKLPGKWVFVDWKPIVWFVKEKRRGQNFISDRLKGEIPDKTELKWAQGSGEVKYLIEELTQPDDLIIDPFAGTGQWGELAGEMGRRWVGSDLKKGGDLKQ